MWRATTKTVVMAVAMIGLGTGCDLASILNQIADQIGQPSDPGDPNDPGDPTVPGDPDRPDEPPCDVPPPPWTDPICEELLDDCLASGQDEQSCFVDFDLCNWDSEPPPVDPGFCEIELDECLNGWNQPVPVNDDGTVVYPPDIDPDFCWIQYDDCMGWEPPPPPPVDFCEIQLDECLNGWWGPEPADEDGTPAIYPGIPDIDPDFCWIQYDECLGWEPPPPPSPCGELLDLCLITGVEPALCEEVHQQCVDNEPGQTEPGDPGVPGWEDGNAGDEDPAAN